MDQVVTTLYMWIWLESFKGLYVLIGGIFVFWTVPDNTLNVLSGTVQKIILPIKILLAEEINKNTK